MVYGQTIRGPDVIANDHKDVGTGQCGTHDTGRLLIPVGPKHEAAGDKVQISSAHVQKSFNII